MIVSQLVLLPLLLLFTWGYIALRPASGRGAGMAAYDAVVVLVAIAASAAAGRLVAGLEPGPEHSIWSTVMTTVAMFHVFPAVLLAGWYLRRRVFAGTGGA